MTFSSKKNRRLSSQRRENILLENKLKYIYLFRRFGPAHRPVGPARPTSLTPLIVLFFLNKKKH